MKLLIKTYPNPLLALAFRDGVNFVGDPDYKALEPKKEGDKWEVIIEHEDDEDDVANTTIGPELPPKKQTTLRDFEERLTKMKPVAAKSAPEVIHHPVKIISKYNYNPVWPCGECVPCSNGQDCIAEINAALMGER